MQYLAKPDPESNWVQMFATSEEAVKYAEVYAQKNPGTPVLIYKAEQVIRTEKLPTNVVKIDTIEGDVVKYLESLVDTKSVDDELCYDNRYN